jgi:predicted transcriptional regulator
LKIREDSERALIRVFGSTSRARILSLLLDNPGTPFYQREVMYETALSLQAVQRELSNLVELGIVERRDEPNRVYYGINAGSPLVGPLRKMFESLARDDKEAE